MHRNTAILIAFLAIVAALLIGINVGRRFSGGSVTPSPSPVVTIPSPSPKLISYTHPRCQVSLNYPPDFKVTEASDSAILTGENNERIVLLCGTDFPKPPLPPERIEEATVAGQIATLYHDASAKDGTPIDIYVFNHPENGLEIALFGFGSVFKEIITSLKLL